MEYYIYGGLTVVILILLVIIRNLLKQTEQLDDMVKLTKLDSIKKVQSTLIKMKEIDNRGVFEKDDEVGVSFHELLNLINELYKSL